MSAQQALPGMNETETTPAYCLSQLEVFNWGPFSGLHRMAFDPAGCSLIGQTGSGKTTLVDAIMTLICAQPRYNLASTGGHESDRDLISYVRGVTGVGGEDDSIHTARPAQTITGISVELSQGESTLRLIALLWLDSSSTSQSDMKRLWLFDTSTIDANNNEPVYGLADYLQLLQEQGTRNFKLHFKELQGVLVTENKKAYLAQVRRFFEVGENAFVLLNRAAGLKQLNSIDELFRELVLDNRSAFKRAAEVANEFDDLTGIHAELEIAKQQQQSLLPVEKTEQQRAVANSKLNQLNELNDLLPQWYAHQAYRLWANEIAAQQHEIERCSLALEQHEQQAHQQQTLVDDCYQRYQKLGGASIEDLKRQIDDQHQQHIRLQQNARDYQQLCQTLTFKNELSREQLRVNQQQAETKLTTLNAELDELEHSREQQTQQTLNAEDQLNSLNKEISQVLATPDSSIPSDFRHFQQALAEELQISPQQIPYIGQCIEVQDKLWQGAIERAIGSHRLRLVVAPNDMHPALNWINQRNNRLHVRLLNSADYQQTRQPLDNGFCHKVKFKQDGQPAVVKNFLAGIDRHCVASADELKNQPYGLTREGLMSGKKGLFEKQDQRALNQGWITGFDNRSRLTELKQQQLDAKQLAEELRQQLEALKVHQQHLTQQKSLLVHLQTIDYSELNVADAEALLEQLKQRLSALQNPESDTAKAEQQWHEAKNTLTNIQETIQQLKISQGRAQDKKQEAHNKATRAKQRLAQSLTEKQIERLKADYAMVESDQREQLVDLEREAMHALQQKTTRQQQKLAALEGQLGRQMVNAKQKDTGALSEAGTELEDVAAYMEQLKQLTREALPDKLERFLHYLNQSSDQGVTQLLTRIENEVSVIEERIEELNATLREVDFQAGRYLQLLPQKVSHESLQTLHKAQRNLRSAALQDDQGESHYKALMALIQLLRDAVERKRTRPAQALLDPRYRLQFSVEIIERDSGTILETRTGSKGGSGGEKEIIASFILTASLSYALCPKNCKTPLFGTVILDEAFSKSSQAVAARIILALREFGLHPLFVTPNKEMRLLRTHTQSAVLVHRRQQQSSAVSLSWQEIDQHLKQQITKTKQT
ncbi:FIG007317: Chromosome segregation protein SMC-like [hydrothermal vent metagenome]|uniref:FIG007317: Chromosome segregation protein SMC-like n=1 Tax=hydrothermal vent metagenome TaxID=652676 RepID=A0A3B0WKH0_9ZZZZ